MPKPEEVIARALKEQSVPVRGGIVPAAIMEALHAAGFVVVSRAWAEDR